MLHNQMPQTHYFNCPRQLAKLPEKLRNSNAVVDYPRDADTYSVTLRHGDVILAYTDGLSDNVFPTELIQIVSLVLRSAPPEDQIAQVIAEQCVLYASQCMFRTNRVSPFQKAAAQNHEYWPGGKIDDVTVVAAYVSEEA
jgi:protein phosphatase PTC7